MPLYGDGLNVRDWLHVDDHCRGIQLVAEKGRDGEVYNIGGGTELTNRDLTHRLLAARRRGPRDDRAGGRPPRATTAATAWTGPRSPTSWATRPRVPFDEGLAATVAWYRDRRDWWEPLKR